MSGFEVEATLDSLCLFLFYLRNSDLFLRRVFRHCAFGVQIQLADRVRKYHD